MNASSTAAAEISRHASYREYLRTVFSSEKSHRQTTTVAKFARQVGFSPSLFKMVLSGQRNLTVTNVHKIATALKLSMEEREYFEALVLENQAEAAEEKRFYKQKLRACRERMRIRTIRVASSKLIAKWYLPALLVYIIDRCKVKKDGSILGLDKSLVAEALTLTPSEVDAAVREVIRHGFVEVDSGENVHVVVDRVTSSYSEVEYVKGCLQAALGRVEKEFSSKEALFCAHTFSIDQEKVPEFIRDYKGLLNHYIGSLEKSGAGAPIVQANLQFFPVIK